MLPPEVLSSRDFAAVTRTPLCYVVIKNRYDQIGLKKVADVMLDQQSVGMALRAPGGSKTLERCNDVLKDSRILCFERCHLCHSVSSASMDA